jgi:hypothetical protein
MDINIWVILVTISFLLILTGYVFNPDTMLYSILGLAFLFTLSIPLMNGQVEYKTGSNITMTETTASVSNIYSSFNDSISTFIGKFLAMLCILGTVMIIINMRVKYNEGAD